MLSSYIFDEQLSVLLSLKYLHFASWQQELREQLEHLQNAGSCAPSGNKGMKLRIEILIVSLPMSHI